MIDKGGSSVITGIHAVVGARSAKKAQAFFRDVLGLPFIDAGGGRLFFALPPAELGVHAADAAHAGRHELYLQCDDIRKAVAALKRKRVKFTSPVKDMGWGLLTTLRIPGAGTVGLYEPRHPSPLKRRRRR